MFNNLLNRFGLARFSTLNYQRQNQFAKVSVPQEPQELQKIAVEPEYISVQNVQVDPIINNVNETLLSQDEEVKNASEEVIKDAKESTEEIIA